jgi:hypothetical protein
MNDYFVTAEQIVSEDGAQSCPLVQELRIRRFSITNRKTMPVQAMSARAFG